MKLDIKRLIKRLFLTLALPLYLAYRSIILIADPDSTFRTFSQFLSLIPGKTGVFFRAAFYHLACTDTSDEISIGFLTVLSHRDTTIRKGVYIGPQSNIGKCHIGENTLLGSGVHILSGKNQHNFSDIDSPIQEQGGTYIKVKIGENCWLGNGSIIMADVASHCIVAAGSVSAKPLAEEASIYAGNPAKFLKSRAS